MWYCKQSNVHGIYNIFKHKIAPVQTVLVFNKNKLFTPLLKLPSYILELLQSKRISAKLNTAWDLKFRDRTLVYHGLPSKCITDIKEKLSSIRSHTSV